MSQRNKRTLSEHKQQQQQQNLQLQFNNFCLIIISFLKHIY